MVGVVVVHEAEEAARVVRITEAVVAEAVVVAAVMHRPAVVTADAGKRSLQSLVVSRQETA
jgi:hypothetical protein